MAYEAQRRYDLFISDIDGTLIHSDVQIPAHVIDEVQHARSHGMRVTLASGRNAAEVEWFSEQLGSTEPYIALGGAYVGIPGNNQTLLYEPLPLDIVLQVLKTVRDAELSVMLEHPKVAYFEGDADFYNELQSISVNELVNLQQAQPGPDDPPAKVVVVGDGTHLDKLEQLLNQYADEIEYSRSLPFLVDITRRGSNKGSALRCICDHLGIPPDRVAVAGDGLNDRSMFTLAGFSVAMAGASQGLIDVSDDVVPDGVEQGFLWALHRALGKPADFDTEDSVGSAS